YEAQIRELNRNHQEAQRSVRAYQENLLATSTSRIENLREVVGMSLTGYADSARVMNNILSGNTINMFGGEEAQRHDPRADNPNDAWVFERNAEGKPKGFGYRIGERR
ncbi:MAG: hypothetical protein Q8P81_00070, partial [Nanoarchaeota archaeon]|nr:hypothetical protein [Nanoarchaeota archaeon]